MTKSSQVRPASARRARKEGTSSFALWLIGGSVLVVAIAVGLIIWSNRTVATPIATLDLPNEWINGTSLGDPAATVTVQAWEDFLCPHCQDWTSSVEPNLINDYVKSGKVRFEFRPFPLQGFEPGSRWAALAGECAAQQNGFWPYHDRLFEAARQQGQVALTFEKLVEYAGEVGLEGQAFNQCLSSQTTLPLVEASKQEATALGLTGTPYVVINGIPSKNAFDYPTLQSEIDSALGTQTGQ